MFGFNGETRGNGQPRSRRRQLVLSYVPDYVVVAVMAILWGLLNRIEPFHRDFSLTNKTIQYPNKPDSVPFYAAVILCFVFPLVVIFLWTGLLRRSFHDMNSGVLGLCVSLVLNMMITNTIKNLAGRHRPDFIDRCNLDKSKGTALEPVIGLLTTNVCRQTDKNFFWDGMRSFPSGHTSFSFAGLTYLSLWLAGHLKIADGRGRAYKSFVVLIPELVALLIGVSRTKDYRHHWQDVLAGALLGIFMGWFGYRQYYPSPMNKTEDPSMPYPPRIPEEAADSFGMKSFARARPENSAGNAQALDVSGVNSAPPMGSSTSVARQGYPASQPAGAGSSGPAYSQHHQQQTGPRAPEGAYGVYTRNSSVSELRV
ncbi:acid phosphatase/Vanadium-dependent haloperoxidase [Martensiomyces pterosporus]|nr:acid phosphatase/Vanadium-dependent haloperoxidase [Martensiomyces pterosporus]